jgi:HK97 family phage major capsid protein
MPANSVEEQLETVVKELGTVKTDLTKQQTELKGAHTQVMDAIAKGLPLDKESRENIDKALSKANETGGAVAELAQKMDAMQKSLKEGLTAAKPVTLRTALQKSLDEHTTKDVNTALAKREIRSLRLVVKDVDAAAIAGIRPSPYQDSLVSMERQPLRVRNLLNVVPITTDSVRYGRQSVRTNMAAIVAEKAPKPYSTYAWENQTATVEVIAHLAKLTLQAIADAPRLVAEIEGEMRFGLALAEEDELLNGDGTTGHLDGLIENATPYSPPAGVTMTNVLGPIDKLRLAILQIHLAYAAPDAHVLNPVDVANIELLRRDPDKGGGYLFGNPDTDTGVLRLWRLPVVESPSMGVGEFLTGAFKYAATLYQREGVTALISTENEDDFEKNLATMRVEERLGLAVKRPYALVYGATAGS